MKEELKEKREKSHNTPRTSQNKGITLVALIITIIVLLILAVVAIRAVQGDGIISHSKNARAEYEKAQAEEEKRLLEYEYQIASAQGTFTGSYDEYALDKKYPGLNLGDKVNNYTVDGYSGEWRVLGIENGQVLLVATTNPISSKTLSGSDATLGVWDEETKSYKNAEEELTRLCQPYLNPTYASKARSIKVEDIDKITGYDKTTYGAGANTYKYGNEVTYSLEKDENGNVTGVVYSSTAKSGTSTSYKKFKKPQTTANITEPYTVISTDYSYDVDQKTGLKNKTSNVYKMLFGNDYQSYWLASSYVIANEGIVTFGMRCVGLGSVRTWSLWSSYAGAIPNSDGVRPVVYLKSDIQLTETAANSGEWNIV